MKVNRTMRQGPQGSTASDHGDGAAEIATRVSTDRRTGRVILHAVHYAIPVLFALTIAAAYALRWSLVVPTFHMDGAFQTASGPFRLAGGEWPGRDFFPYLGIGPVLILFPLFTLLGGDISSSVFSAHFATLVSLQLVVAVVATLMAPRRRGLAFVWGMAASAMLVAAAHRWPALWYVNLELLSDAALPGNSLRPLRALAPYVLAAVSFLALGNRWSWRRTAVVGGTAGAIGSLWSNDYGLVSCGLLLVVLTYHAVRRRLPDRLRGLGALLGCALGGFLTSGFAATAGHFPAMLSYNLSDVRQDQAWYFGPWLATYRVHSLGDLVRNMALERAHLALPVLLAVAVYALVRRGLGSLMLAFVGATTLAGGLTGTVGGHAGGYFWAFYLWACVVTCLAALRLASVAMRSIGRRSGTHPPRTVIPAVRTATTLAAVALLTGVGFAAVRETVDAEAAAASDPGYVFDDRLGGFLPIDFAEHVVGVHRAGPDVVEEYTGLAGVLNGPNQDLPVDSLIAALGSQRDVFAAFMERRHDLVVTTTPTATQWTTWNLSANCWFYRNLFRSYTPAQTSPLTLSWTPARPATWADVPCDVDGPRVVVDARAAGFYEVTLEYTGPSRGSRSFTMVENNINVMEDARGFLALDPRATMQRFPLAVREPTPGGTTLSLRDVPGDDEPLTRLKSCTAAAIDFPDGAATMDLFGYLVNTPFDLTDVNWTKGVANASAGFFIPYTERNLADVRSARAVRFEDGTTRDITSVVPASPWLNVYLEGPPLDPDAAGAPHPYTLLR